MSTVYLTPDETSTLAAAGQTTTDAVTNMAAGLDQDAIEILKLIAQRIKALGG